MESRKIAYIYNDDIRKLSDKLPTMKYRSTIVQDLIISYGLTKQLNIVNPTEATYDQLLTFHTNQYIDFIKSTKTIDKSNDTMADTHGLLYDCPLLENMYSFITTIAGGSITAANILNSKDYQHVINWFGGWHHAQSNQAEGFCYVNDIVLAIKHLNYDKIMYLDLDVHHGDGVEDAFKDNPNILTLSIHKCSPGFYPGTGHVSNDHEQKSMVNVPLLDGISNDTYNYVFGKIFRKVFDVFQPDAIVVQCGADILAGDPLGECNVTLETMGKCVKDVLNCDKPTMFLGGGGYKQALTARYWCYLTALILDAKLDDDIPDVAQFFQLYTPTFELTIDQILGRKDYNTKEYLDQIIQEILAK